MSRISKIIALVVLALALTAVTALPASAAGVQGGGPVCFGNSLTIATGQSVDGVLAFGCNVTVQEGATVRGDLIDFGGNVSVAGQVQGNIVVFGGNVNIDAGADIGGNITTLGGNVQSAPGAVVQGNVNPNRGRFLWFPHLANPFTGFGSFGFDILGGIVTALAFAALGALVVIFAPNATQRVSDAAVAKPFNTAGVGCLTLILLPILGILLVITLIGIPIAFLLTLAAGAAWVFGGIGIGLLAGEKILKAFRASNILPVVAVVLGILVLMIIGQVPILGWFISCIVGLIGLGAVVLTRFGTRPYPAPPTMALTPAFAAAGAGVPGTYTPTPVDVAAWEAKAAAAQSPTPQAGDAPAPTATEPGAAETPPPKSDSPPGESQEPKADS